MAEQVDAAVRMAPHDWNRVASEAVTLAVRLLHEKPGPLATTDRVNAITSAGELLCAARAMRSHANLLELEGGEDVAQIDGRF